MVDFVDILAAVRLIFWLKTDNGGIRQMVVVISLFMCCLFCLMCGSFILMAMV